MKNNVFLVSSESRTLGGKKFINTVKRKRKLGKVDKVIMTGIRWLWFALRITLANMLHYSHGNILCPFTCV